MRKLLLSFILTLMLAISAMATDITIETFQINNAQNLTGTVTLRVWFTGCNGTNFLDSNNQLVMCGSATSNFYQAVPVTVVGNTLTVPAFVLPSTDDSSNPAVLAHAQFFQGSSGKAFLFSNFVVTHTLGSSISYAELYNWQPVDLPGPTNPSYLNAVQVSSLINSAVGELNVATTTSEGLVRVSSAPADPLHPVAVETTDPRMPTQNENDALAGTNGTPSAANKYVTNTDPRNTNARTPTTHATSHQVGGTDVVTVNLASQTTGNLPVTALNSGTNASGSTVWHGDGAWRAVTIPQPTELTNIILTGNAPGTQVGASSSDKVGVFGATPIVQPSGLSATSGATLGQLETEVNSIKAIMRDLGLMSVVYSPSDLPNMLRWYKADVLALADGTAVSSWTDSSAALDPAVQATGTKQGVFKTNIVNTKPVIRLDGSDDFFSFVGVSTIRTAYFVVKHDTGTQNNAPLLGHSTLFDWSGGGSVGQGRFLFDSNASGNILNGGAWVNGQADSAANILKSTNFRIYSFVTTGNVSAEYITNDRNAVGRYWDGDYAEIILYSAAHTNTQRQGIEAYLRNKYALTDTIVLRPLAILDGNSLTINDGYHVRVFNCLAGNCASPSPLTSDYIPYNFGVGAQTTTAMAADLSTQVLPLYNASRTDNIYVPWEITNELYFGLTKEQAYANYVALCTTARSAGFKVVAVTVLPRSGGSTPGDFEASRSWINTQIRNNYTTFADSLADVGGDPTVGEAGDELNLTYYSDGTHLTVAGYDVIKSIVGNAILAL